MVLFYLDQKFLGSQTSPFYTDVLHFPLDETGLGHVDSEYTKSTARNFIETWYFFSTCNIAQLGTAVEVCP